MLAFIETCLRRGGFFSAAPLLTIGDCGGGHYGDEDIYDGKDFESDSLDTDTDPSSPHVAAPPVAAVAAAAAAPVATHSYNLRSRGSGGALSSSKNSSSGSLYIDNYFAAAK